MDTVGRDEGLLQEEAPLFGFVVSNYGLYRAEPS